MFRAQQNAFDDVVAKATDENLTSENWEYIMDVCDKVTGEDSGGKDAVASMIKRLAHRNANVQLYTLELANALSQNCGAKMHRELASRAFTDALLRLAGDRNTHQQVKAKILERMQEWADMFKDPELGIMKDQYYKLKTQNPNLHPPSAPQKSRLTDLDRQKEEEELQMALKLSIQDKTPKPQVNAAPSSSGPPQAQAAPVQQPMASGTTAATVSRVRALFDFHATDPDELTFRKGDIIAVLESVYKDWWKGLLRGQTGIFPLNYVEKLADPTPEELQREAQMEAEVFAEIKNVEKLLTLLSTSTSDLNVRDNEEITKLYHSTLAIRPKLIELIGKYSQRKDDFTQLNERFIKSCRDYESLLDASMTQTQPSYGYNSRPPYGGPSGAPPHQRYTPGPAQQEQPYPQTSSPQGYPPQPLRTGPAPFYVVAPQGQAEPAGAPSQQAYPPRDNAARIPSNQQAPPLQTQSPPPSQYPGPQTQTGHRPESTYSNPQELATSIYNSPIGGPNRRESTYSASLYSQEDPYSATGAASSQPPLAQQQYSAYAPTQQPPQPPSQQQPSQPQYNAYAPPQQTPQQQPSYGAPPVPTGSAPPPPSSAGYPNISQDARQTLPSQAQPSAPADYYRQSTAY